MPAESIAELTPITRQDREGLIAVRELHREVWGVDQKDGLPVHLLQAILISGGVVLLASYDRQPVGFLVGLNCFDPEDDSCYLYLHNVGVLSRYAGQGIGFQLMDFLPMVPQADRFAYDQLVFDPADVRNAKFYIERLGFDIVRYSRDHWGVMSDDLNRGRVTDRLIARRDRMRGPDGGGESSGVMGSSGWLPSVGVKVPPEQGGSQVLIAIPDQRDFMRTANSEAKQRVEAFRSGFESVLNERSGRVAGIVEVEGGGHAYVLRASEVDN